MALAGGLAEGLPWPLVLLLLLALVFDRLGHGLRAGVDLMRPDALMRLGQLMALGYMVFRHGHPFRALGQARFLFAPEQPVLSDLVLAMLGPTIVFVALDNRLLLPIEVL